MKYFSFFITIEGFFHNLKAMKQNLKANVSNLMGISLESKLQV